MTADHSGANKHWMNQRNLMRASIRNHRVYLYIRDIIDISKLNTCQKEELHCKSTRRTSKHLTSAVGRKTLSFFPLGHSRSRSRYWTVGLGSKGPSSSSRRPMFTGECITVKITGTVRWWIGNLLTPCEYLDTLCHDLEKFEARHMS